MTLVDFDVVLIRIGSRPIIIHTGPSNDRAHFVMAYSGDGRMRSGDDRMRSGDGRMRSGDGRM